MVVITIPKGKNSVDKFDVLVSQNTEASAMYSTDSFRECMNKIQRIVLAGQGSQSSIHSLSNAYKLSFQSESYMIELLHYLEYSEDDKVKHLIEQNIHKVLGKADYECLCNVMLVTAEEMEVIGTQEDELGDSLGNTESLPDVVPPGSDLIKYQFVLSPVTGTVLTELRLGDQIMIKLLEDNDKAKAIVGQMNLKDEAGNIHPCPATIVSIDNEDIHKIEVIVKINETTFGRYIEEEPNVRVKMAEISSLSRDEKILRDAALAKEKSWVVPAAVLIVILAILWILVVFIL